MISALSLLVKLKDLRCANHSATKVKQTTYAVYALVDATESSLPQFIKTPQSFSLARVLLTLLTTLILCRPWSLAILNGINRSIVSPD